jgi:DNA repair photolyase
LSELEPQSIYIGWNCDPYQPAEKSQRQTRQALELLGKRGFSVCILTKSDLAIRDIDLLADMQGSSAGISIAFQDEQVRGLFEPKAPENARRIEALKLLKDSGIETYALICPVMPFITDTEVLVERVAPYADKVWAYALNMEAEGDLNWQNVRGILDRNFPGMSKRYRQIAFSDNHPYWTELRQNLEGLKREKYHNLQIKL